MANVYVVVGETGEYSDRKRWNVAAFLDDKDANALRDHLMAWVKGHGYHDRGYSRLSDERPKPQDDPGFNVDYTGTQYVVEVIPLRSGDSH